MKAHYFSTQGRRLALGVMLLGVVSLTLPSTSGCSKREDSLRYCDVPSLFQSSCDGALCHGSQSPRADLDLVSPGVDQRLFHVAASSNCDERKLVVPGHPEQSVLYLKVSKDEPFCGDKMPLNRHLSPDELSCLREYINNAGTDTDGQQCETCGTILCVDFNLDPAHCGGCNQACEAGLVCGAGTCVNPCDASETLCGASCAQLEKNNDHCGSCGHRCAPGSTCEKGVCLCDPLDGGTIGNGGEGGSIEAPSFQNHLIPLFESSCGGILCHTGEDSFAPLSLDPSMVYQNLLGTGAKDCAGREYVVPKSPDQSYLIEKLMGGSLCAGDRMPLGNEELAKSTLRSVTQWICAGALDN